MTLKDAAAAGGPAASGPASKQARKVAGALS